jgi:Kef-type K+ transport system membrane component KefB
VSNSELAILFFLQLAVILGACRLVGMLAKKIGQPQVVGEMIAGVLLGPSLFGLLLPHVQQYVFPTLCLQSGWFSAVYVPDWHRI